MSPTVGKNVMYLSVILCVVGFILVSGSLLTESYTTKKPFRVDESIVQLKEAFTLQPNTNIAYPRVSEGTNMSILQIDINNTNALVVKIAEERGMPKTRRYEAVFERAISGGGPEQHYFWTPPRSSPWYFVFNNSHPTPTNISVKVTEHFLKRIEDQEVTHYCPLLEPSFAYTGITAIIMGTGLNLACSLIGSGDPGKKQKYRKFTAISTPLFILGIILALESIVIVPYVTLEPFRVDRSKILLNKGFSLYAESNRTFVLDSLIRNTSILEIRMKMSDAVGFRIIDQHSGRVDFFGGEPEDGIGIWEGKVFWTPPFNSEWQVFYYNPFSTSRNISVKVTEYHFNLIEYREVTHYRPLLDPYYGYTGIAAIAVATALNLIPLIRESSEEYQRQIERKTYQTPPK